MDTAARELARRFISSLIENRLEQQEPSSGSSRNAGSEWGGIDGSPNKSTVIYGRYGGRGYGSGSVADGRG